MTAQPSTPLTLLRREIDKAGGTGNLAELLGFNPSFISDVVNGKRRLSKELAYRLQERLGMDGRALVLWQAGEDWRRHVEGKRGVQGVERWK